MTVLAADLSVAITPDLTALDKGMSEAEDRVKKGADKIDSIGEKVGRTFGKGISFALGDVGSAVQSLENLAGDALEMIPGIGAGLKSAFGEAQGAINNAISKGFDWNDTMKRARISLTYMTGDVKVAMKEISDLRAIGSEDGFSFPLLLNAARDLQNMGMRAERVPGAIRAIADASAALGGGEDRLNGMANALARVLEKGVVGERDLKALVNQGLPAYDILAERLHKTKAQIKDLARGGYLDAEAFVDVFLDEFKKRYAGAAKEMSETIDTQTRKVASGQAALYGVATQGLYEQVVQGEVKLNEALRSDPAKMMAANLQNMLAAPGALMMKVLDAMSSGDPTGGAVKLGLSITEGMKAGLVSGAEGLFGQVKSLLSPDSGVLGIAADILGVRSPSKKFEEMGRWCAEGFKLGLEEGTPEAVAAAQAMMNNVLGGARQFVSGPSSAQRKSLANLESLIAREPDFLPKLIQMAQSRGINPDQLLNVIAVETAGSFSPSAHNPHSTATGLIQFMADTARGLGTTTAALSKMSATQQLDYVFKYLDNAISRFGPLNTQGRLYATVGAGHPVATDESVLMRRGDRGYAGNAPTWDRDMDGVIKQGEMAVAAIAKLGAGLYFTADSLLGGGGGQSFASRGTNPAQTNDTFQRWNTFVNNSLAELRSGDGSRSSAGPPIPIQTIRETVPLLFEIRGEADQISTSLGQGLFSKTWKDIPIKPLILDMKELGVEGEQSVTAVNKELEKTPNIIHATEAEIHRLSLHWKDAADAFESTFGSALGNIQGGAKEFLKTFVLDFIKALEQMAAAAIAANLRNLLFGSPSDNTGGGHGWLGAIFGALFGAFTGGASGGAHPSTSTPVFHGWARGGDPPVGVPSWVGEEGPELFVPKTPGTIFNQQQLAALGGQKIINNNVTIVSREARALTAPKSRRQIRDEMLGALQTAY